ncbi:MAG: homogentisate 1,2-dioxygenase, partial [Flavobacteriaceae bacterium]|nr:homogentisate 1,2-dioxygenase [Flavobacteriaceae bacterium]
LFGTVGFDGMYSNIYHCYRPTMLKEIKTSVNLTPEIAVPNNMKSYRFHGFNIPPENDYLESRKIVLTNPDVHIVLAAPKKSMTDYFYKNADSDELIFIHKGSGVLKTMLGNLEFSYGDYLLIPRGMIYQMHFNDQDNRLLITESRSPIYTPKRYRNWFGQLLEHSPFCERDIRKPQELITIDQKGDFEIKVKKRDELFSLIYASHPFDVVGYDGFNYPYALSIHDFEPITGRIHQPPPVHQTFETDTFVICSFVPRLYDYHPESIPAPYNHSNIDSDEVLYYVDGDFMSRNDIAPGHISLHPAGIPHGPHPGAAERSIGKTETEELAVMIDTFKPLQLTQQALDIADESYHKSWLE